MSVCTAKLTGPVMAASLLQSGSVTATASGPHIQVQQCPNSAARRPDPVLRRAIDNEVICSVTCCCAENPGQGAAGQDLMQSCVNEVFSAADAALGYKSRYKSELSWNVNNNPPTPYMHRENGSDTTQPSERWQTRAENDFGKDYGGKGYVRRPDLTIVDDPCRPPGPGNTERVVEIKFRGDQRDEQVDKDYTRIAGGRQNYSVFRVDAPPGKGEEGCDCESKKRPQEVPVTVPATKPAEQEEGKLAKTLSAVGWTAVTVIAAAATVVAVLSPFDGPVGDIAAGSGTAAAAARAAQAWGALQAAF